MKRIALMLAAAATLLSACGGSAARTGRTAAATRAAETAEPVYYTYRIRAVHPHAT